MKKIIILIITFCSIQNVVFGLNLDYKFTQDDVLSIDMDIDYNIFLNGKYLNRFSSKEISRNVVVSNNEYQADINSSLTIIDNGDDYGRFKKSKSYNYSFSKNKNGKTSGLEYINGLHDFPVFPDNDLKIGDSWISTSLFNMTLYDPANIIGVKMEIQYRVIGIEKNENDDIVLISANAVFVKDKNAEILSLFGVLKLGGYCNFLVKFNRTKGVLYSIDETFDYFYVSFDMSVVELSGRSSSSTKFQTKSSVSDRTFQTDDNVPEIIKFDNPDKDIKVVVEKDNSILITLVNLRFLSDSKILLDNEKEKLDLIANVIKSKYVEKRIVVIGHAASTGKPKTEMILSEERAMEVIDYLVKKHGLKKELFSFEGKGSTEQIGDNSAESGKAMNRRVEIRILPD
jgi:outer membrane protein OmpA-like peptidoglycan-associated protein